MPTPQPTRRQPLTNCLPAQLYNQWYYLLANHILSDQPATVRTS